MMTLTLVPARLSYRRGRNRRSSASERARAACTPHAHRRAIARRSRGPLVGREVRDKLLLSSISE